MAEVIIKRSVADEQETATGAGAPGAEPTPSSGLSVEGSGGRPSGTHDQGGTPLVSVRPIHNGRTSSLRQNRDKESFVRGVLDHLAYTCGREADTADMWAVYEAVAYAMRDRLLHQWLQTRDLYRAQRPKRIYYLSAEFLLGRALTHNLINTDMYAVADAAMRDLGLELSQIIEQPSDPGLGNGGLGRLAACFLDSMATMGYAGYGYGIRYEFGAFEQSIESGWQRERADGWLRYGNPWEIQRHEFTAVVNFGGRVEQSVDDSGRARYRWIDTRQVLGVPHDHLIAGYRNGVVNTLRLWSARASRQLDLEVFNDGDYRAAVEDKVLSESISKVLYPNDDSYEGKRLRLSQQYFFVCCSIWDLVRRFERYHTDYSEFPASCAIHLNDTHPAIAIVELMRVLVDDKKLPWDQAWDITQRTMAYTNHTLLPEALERWPVPLFEELLPRHLQIIYEINHRFLRDVHVFAPNDHSRQRRMSIIEEGAVKQVRMAHLAVVGSHSVNGVARLHSELIKTDLMPEFAELWPDRFCNVTNGVTPRRWLLNANPRLSRVIESRLGASWATNLDSLEGLLAHRDDAGLMEELAEVKRANKVELAELARERAGVELSPEAVFTVHVKRFHEYKRQLLSALHIVHLYRQMRSDPERERPAQVFVFSGKAAPGYAMAKLHIKLIHDIAEMINRDPVVADRLKVVFLPNYSVSLAEAIMPAADLSLQTSLAGTEASGTGNMKMAINGALTIGTHDGANIEIRERVGADYFFQFGLLAHEVRALRESGYKPRDMIARSEALQGVLGLLRSGFFCPDDIRRYHGLVDVLEKDDYYMVCADFESYAQAQEHAMALHQDPSAWGCATLHNIANMGAFSSDATIRRYAREIWRATPVVVSEVMASSRLQAGSATDVRGEVSSAPGSQTE